MLPLPQGWLDITPGLNLQCWTIVDVPVDGPLSPSPHWSVDTKTGMVRCSGRGFLFGNSLVNGEIKRVAPRDQLSGANPAKPAGEWNCTEIACIDSSLSLKVNGIAASRWEHVAVLRGYVGLEAEG